MWNDVKFNFYSISLLLTRKKYANFKIYLILRFEFLIRDVFFCFHFQIHLFSHHISIVNECKNLPDRFHLLLEFDVIFAINETMNEKEKRKKLSKFPLKWLILFFLSFLMTSLLLILILNYFIIYHINIFYGKFKLKVKNKLDKSFN